MFECEAGCEEARWNHSAAFENELGLGAEDERSCLEHPARCRQTETNAPRFSELCHEFHVWERIGRGHIDASGEFVVLDDPADCAHEIAVVDPGDELSAVSRPPAQPAPHEAE